MSTSIRRISGTEPEPDPGNRADRRTLPCEGITKAIAITIAITKRIRSTIKINTTGDGYSASFPSTRWTQVIAAGGRAAPEARAALAELCEAYWYPIYALIRRRGHGAEEACDLTQDYFTRLLEKPVIAAADQSKGRFRAFLRTDCQHFLIDQQRRKRARAGVLKTVSINAGDAENRYRFEPTDNVTPDKLFDRTWAMTLLDRVLELLAQEYAAKGQADVFDGLKVVLSQGKGAVQAAELAAQLGMKAPAVYTAIHRLKKRYRAILQKEIADTLDEPADVDAEVVMGFG